MGTSRQRNQHIEVQVAQLFGSETQVFFDPGQNLPGLKPVVLRGCKNRVVSFQSAQESLLTSLGNTTPKLGQNHR